MDELWPKVVECYFKKPLLGNLFHKHLFSPHAGNLFFYFLILYFNMFFLPFNFFWIVPFNFFFKEVPFNFITFISKEFYYLFITYILISTSFNYHNLTDIFNHTVIEWHKYFYSLSSTSQIYIHTLAFRVILYILLYVFLVTLLRIIFF